MKNIYKNFITLALLSSLSLISTIKAMQDDTQEPEASTSSKTNPISHDTTEQDVQEYDDILQEIANENYEIEPIFITRYIKTRNEKKGEVIEAKVNNTEDFFFVHTDFSKLNYNTKENAEYDSKYNNFCNYDCIDIVNIKTKETQYSIEIEKEIILSIGFNKDFLLILTKQKNPNRQISLQIHNFKDKKRIIIPLAKSTIKAQLNKENNFLMTISNGKKGKQIVKIIDIGKVLTKISDNTYQDIDTTLKEDIIYETEYEDSGFIFPHFANNTKIFIFSNGIVQIYDIIKNRIIYISKDSKGLIVNSAQLLEKHIFKTDETKFILATTFIEPITDTRKTSKTFTTIVDIQTEEILHKITYKPDSAFAKMILTNDFFITHSEGGKSIISEILVHDLDKILQKKPEKAVIYSITQASQQEQNQPQHTDAIKHIKFNQKNNILMTQSSDKAMLHYISKDPKECRVFHIIEQEFHIINQKKESNCIEMASLGDGIRIELDVFLESGKNLFFKEKKINPFGLIFTEKSYNFLLYPDNSLALYIITENTGTESPHDIIANRYNLEQVKAAIQAQKTGQKYPNFHVYLNKQNHFAVKFLKSKEDEDAFLAHKEEAKQEKPTIINPMIMQQVKDDKEEVFQTRGSQQENLETIPEEDAGDHAQKEEKCIKEQLLESMQATTTKKQDTSCNPNALEEGADINLSNDLGNVFQRSIEELDKEIMKTQGHRTHPKTPRQLEKKAKTEAIRAAQKEVAEEKRERTKRNIEAQEAYTLLCQREREKAKEEKAQKMEERRKTRNWFLTETNSYFPCRQQRSTTNQQNSENNDIGDALQQELAKLEEEIVAATATTAEKSEPQQQIIPVNPPVITQKKESPRETPEDVANILERLMKKEKEERKFKRKQREVQKTIDAAREAKEAAEKFNNPKRIGGCKTQERK